MGMAKEPTRSNVVAIIIGVAIGAIGGMFIGWIAKMWGLAIGFTVAFIVVWMIAQKAWFARREQREIEDPYEGR
jgi:O-antigen/teichoic acid export membrane protein